MNREPGMTAVEHAQPSKVGSVLLRAQGVTKGYWMGKKRVEVLFGVDLCLNRGDFLTIQGASGAGKTTLLHLLGGLDHPDAGEVFFQDMRLGDLAPRNLAQFRNQRVGFIFQAYHLFPEFDALENVSMPARIARKPVQSARDQARSLLEKVGLGHRLDHRPNELSGGEQQRVAIARALVNQPELLIADEPTGNLDSTTGQAITDLLLALQADFKVGLVLATHDQDMARRSGRVVHLVDGKLQP